jgi:hypothetical protein
MRAASFWQMRYHSFFVGQYTYPILLKQTLTGLKPCFNLAPSQISLAPPPIVVSGLQNPHLNKQTLKNLASKVYHIAPQRASGAKG